MGHSKKSKKSKKELVNEILLVDEVANGELQNLQNAPGHVLDDIEADYLASLFKGLDPKAAVLPVIGYPSNANGVVTITHQIAGMPPMRINNLVSNSPLANNALYSAEYSGGYYQNLYEIMIPDVPSADPMVPSTADLYVKLLAAEGLDVAGVHFHWWASTVVPGDKGVIAVHHQKTGMNPLVFIEKTIRCLNKVLTALKP